MLTHSFGEPPAWDAFSKVNVKNLDPSEYEDDEDIEARKKKENAIVKAKPTTLSGWDPDTGTQRILSDDDMNNGAGMGAMDLEHWKVTCMDRIGETQDCSFGARTVMKQLLEAGTGMTNPHPPAQVELTYVGRVKDADAATAALVFDDRYETAPGIFHLTDDTSLTRQPFDARFEVLHPPGLIKAVRSMRPGERAKITMLPDEGFGAAGDESLGVPPDAYLEFVIHLRRIIALDSYDKGAIVKREVVAGGADEAEWNGGKLWANAQPNSEVVVRWEGRLIEDAAPGEIFVDTDEAFRPMSEERFWLGDPATPPFWTTALPSFKLGETSELAIVADAAFGEAGSVPYNVPPGAAIRVLATLISVERIDDISPSKDRSALRRLLVEGGRDFEQPKVRYDVTLDYTATPIPLPPPSLPSDAQELPSLYASLPPAVERVGAIVTVGRRLDEADEQMRLCDGLDVSDALQLLLPKMMRGETSELVYTEGNSGASETAETATALAIDVGDGEGSGGGVAEGTAEGVAEGTAAPMAGAAAATAGWQIGTTRAQPSTTPPTPRAMRLVVTIHSWVRVDPVPSTGGAVLRRQLYVPPCISNANQRSPELPRPESVCRVRYSIRVVSGERWRGASTGELLQAVGSTSTSTKTPPEPPPSQEGEEGEAGIVVLDGSATSGSVPPAVAAPLGTSAVGQFVQGERQVLPCIDAAVLMMRRGERALLTAPAECAFGAPNFPPALAIDERARGSDVEVTLELIDFDQAADENGMHILPKIQLHARRKEAANRLFAKGALREAIAKWELAEKTLPHGGGLRYDVSKRGKGVTLSEAQIETESLEVEKVQISCELNLAAVYLKLGEPGPALENAEKALKKDPQSVKGLFRRGQARMRIPPVDVEEVRADLMAAARLEPKNKDIREELTKLKQVQSDQKREEKSLYGGIFEKASTAGPAKWAQPVKEAKPPPPLAGFASTAFGRRAE
jgi:FKBP-type peptidyl-prolyl cis-trans isomerase